MTRRADLPQIPDTPAELFAPKADTEPGQEPDSPLAPVRNITDRTPRRSRTRTRPRRGAKVSDEELARELDRAFPDTVPGVPTAMPHLRKVFGSCARDRAQAAVRKLAAWRSGEESSPDSDDQESEAVAV